MKFSVLAPTWSVCPKISGRGGCPSQPFFY